jgi:hypothetical protein
MEKKEVLLQTARLQVILSEISADLVQTTESIVKLPDSGAVDLNGWLTNTVNKLTSFSIPIKPRV